MLGREADELSADPPDQVDVAELRADLGDPGNDLPTWSHGLPFRRCPAGGGRAAVKAEPFEVPEVVGQTGWDAARSNR